MLIDNVLCAFTLWVVILRFIMMSAILLCVIMLICHYAEWHCGLCLHVIGRSTNCHYAERCYAMGCNTKCDNAECCYTVGCYAKCHYAKCHFAECRRAA